jgi:predicted transcriptional regulator
MKLSEIRDILDAQVIVGEDKLDEEVCGACGADLMSDVLAWHGDKGVLLTGLTNPQVVRTAEVVGDVKCIVFVRGKNPSSETVELAKQTGLVLMKCKYPMFVACGLLFSRGLVPSDYGESSSVL